MLVYPHEILQNHSPQRRGGESAEYVVWLRQATPPRSGFVQHFVPLGLAAYGVQAVNSNVMHLETLGHMNVICELSEKHIKQLHALYQAEWWTRGRSLENTKQCVNGSQICIGITSENDDLIGFVRVLTDFTFKALIFDVIVTQSERGKGLGNKLLSLVKNHERLKSVRHFELYCLPEMLSFYEKHGFSTNVGEIKLMRLTNA